MENRAIQHGLNRRGKVLAPHLGAVLLAIFGMAGSLVLSPLYYLDDQYFYRQLYEILPSLGSWGERFLDYRSLIGASDPGYLLFITFFSEILTKDVLFSFVNSFLVASLGYWLFSKRVSALIIALICFNFYLLVLFFVAERLKLALLFFLWSLLAANKYKLVWGVLAILSHFQLVFLFASLFILKIHQSKGKIFTKSILSVILLSLPLTYHAIFNFDFYYLKATGYIVDFDEALLGFVKILVFLVFTQFVVKSNRLGHFLMFIPLLFGSIFFGASRLAIFAFFIFMYFGLQYRRGLNLPVFATCVYFAFGGVIFVQTFIEYGGVNISSQ